MCTTWRDDALMRRARRLQHAGAHAETVRTLEEIIRARPQSREAWERLAYEILRRGDTATAFDTATRALECITGNSRLFTYAGIAALRLHRDRDAYALLSAAHAISDAPPEATLALGEILIWRQQYANARIALIEAIATAPSATSPPWIIERALEGLAAIPIVAPDRMRIPDHITAVAKLVEDGMPGHARLALLHLRATPHVSLAYRRVIAAILAHVTNKRDPLRPRARS